ncbi:MAG: hypothetical protein ACRBBV_01270 [Paracoccaceae bacterium]
MTATQTICQAGLVLAFSHPFSITAKATAAAVLQDACARRGIPVTAAPVIGSNAVTIHTTALDIALDYRAGPGHSARLVLSISPLGWAEQVQDDVMQAHLAALCGKLLHQFPCSVVQWLSEEMELPADRFLAMTDPVKPRRVKPRRPDFTPEPQMAVNVVPFPMATAA